MQLVPWILAILWTIWTKDFLVSGLLLLGALWQLREYYSLRLPFQSDCIIAILLLSWLCTAYYTASPIVTLGMLLQLGVFTYFSSAHQTEKRKHLAVLANFNQQTALLFELRKQRHDLQKHTTALQHADLFTDEIKAYRSQLFGQYTEMDELLRRESNITAGALFAYYRQAKEKGIVLEYHIQHAISGLPLAEHERISFISNILENAIEAASEYKEKNGNGGYVILTCRKHSGIWIIICQNSTILLDHYTTSRMYTSKAITTKGGNHEGFGTKQIARIVKNHRGVLDFSAMQNKFILKIKIPDVKT
ncbi:sensor histidine kinase [Bacillus sp. FSL K6-3431]|uniref:sensor histidine kinase n=1 Tax=Bacillus sp. FSL K6-3431 TaxID=2921500 RepID=UPI0030F78D9E